MVRLDIGKRQKKGMTRRQMEQQLHDYKHKDERRQKLAEGIVKEKELLAARVAELEAKNATLKRLLQTAADDRQNEALSWVEEARDQLKEEN